MRYAIVDKDSNVINIVAWDGKTDFPLSDGCRLVKATDIHDNQFAEYAQTQTPDIPTDINVDSLTQALINKGVLTESDLEQL